MPQATHRLETFFTKPLFSLIYYTQLKYLKKKIVGTSTYLYMQRNIHMTDFSWTPSSVFYWSSGTVGVIDDAFDWLLLTAITWIRHTIGWAVRRKSSYHNILRAKLGSWHKPFVSSETFFDTFFFYFQVVSWSDHAGWDYVIRLWTNPRVISRTGSLRGLYHHRTAERGKWDFYCSRLGNLALESGLILCVKRGPQAIWLRLTSRYMGFQKMR